MKVVWFTNIVLPVAAKAMGLPEPVTGGWMSAQLQALRESRSDVQFLVVSSHSGVLRAKVGGVAYATFDDYGCGVFPDGIPCKIKRQVRALVQEFKPDVIHVHGTECYYARLGSDAFCGRPVVVSLQGVINGLAPHYSGGLTRDELAPFRTLRNRVFRDGVFEVQEHWRRERSAQERISLKCHKHYVGRTDWDRAWVKAFNPEAIYHHLDEPMRHEFYTARRALADVRAHSIYCSAAAGYPLKGFHWLLRAVAFLKPRYPDIRVRVADAQRVMRPPRRIIDRLKDRDYPRYLRQLARELDVEENVVALPQLTAPQVVEELRHAHVFCLPSLCENSPNSLCEAMLAGTPSVAMNVGGVPSMMSSTIEGVLCPSADPAALAAAIRGLFDNDAVAERYAAAARERASFRHDPARIAGRLLDIYEQVNKSEGR